MTPKLRREAKVDCRSQSQYLKMKAFLRVVKQFYRSRSFLRRALGGMRSWKNIISIGDSDAERLALQDAVFHHKQPDKNGRWKECRCKTVRFLDEPDLGQLTEQINTLRELLPALARHDGDVDLDMTLAGFEIASSRKSFSIR